MKKTLFLSLAYFLINPNCFSQTTKVAAPTRVSLQNGWSLAPVGNSLPLGDLPLNMAVSPSQKMLAVTNNGQSTQSIQLIDVENEKVLDQLVVPKLWYGLKFSSDGKFLYASGG